MLFKKHHFFIVLLLITSIINYAMEIEKAIINEKPLIKATVYLDPKQPAFYATKEQIKYLNERRINTPIQPILRLVSQAIIKQDDLVLNWRNNLPLSMIRYYRSKLDKNLTQTDIVAFLKKKRDNHRFPDFLPAELSFNCANESRISLTIDGFPTEITFGSDNDFYEEQQQAFFYFFNDACSISPKGSAKELIAAGLLEEKIVRKLLAYINPLNGQPMVFLVDTIEYIHGPKGYPDEKTLVQSLIDAKIQPHTNIALFLKNREMGNLKQSRLYKKNFDGKIEDSL